MQREKRILLSVGQLPYYSRHGRTAYLLNRMKGDIDEYILCTHQEGDIVCVPLFNEDPAMLRHILLSKVEKESREPLGCLRQKEIVIFETWDHDYFGVLVI